MRTFPTLEPVIVEGGSFVLDRVLDQPGEVLVRVGDTVTPETVVAQSAGAERAMTLYIASELGVPNNSVARYLTKQVGSTLKADEVIARARRGLRTVSANAPAAGKILSVDETNGTVIFSAAADRDQLHALVGGEVERVMPDRGAVIRATGSRVFGIIGFGEEAVGPLVVGPDRPDRELTPDQVREDWKGKIVVCGMTVGVPAMNRLKQVGVAGIIVGSLSEADVRRFLSAGGGEAPASHFWNSRHPDALFATAATPFVIVATEGFGRISMADPIFSFFLQQQGQTVSITATTSVGTQLRRPEIYVSGLGTVGDGRATDELLPGRPVRLVDGLQLGAVATCRSAAYQQYSDAGVATTVADVDLETGERRTVPVANIEVLV